MLSAMGSTTATTALQALFFFIVASARNAAENILRNSWWLNDSTEGHIEILSRIATK